MEDDSFQIIDPSMDFSYTMALLHTLLKSFERSKKKVKSMIYGYTGFRKNAIVGWWFYCTGNNI